MSINIEQKSMKKRKQGKVRYETDYFIFVACDNGSAVCL